MCLKWFWKSRKPGKMEENVNHFMALMGLHMDDIVAHPIITRRPDEAAAFWKS